METAVLNRDAVHADPDRAVVQRRAPIVPALIDGVRLRAALQRRGLSSLDFAGLVGVRKATINEIIAGKPVSPEMLFRVALALKLTPEKGEAAA